MNVNKKKEAANTGTSKPKNLFKQYLPILDWGSVYTKQTAINDLVVSIIVSIMLIPQSLAYAQLAGLAPEVGLYASMAPLVLYAIFGTSRSLSVGPVAVTSLMTLAAVAPLAAMGTPEYLAAAMTLALLIGIILIILGLLKLGFLANFMSFPVMAGLCTAVGLQIAAGQLTPVMGIPADGGTFLAQCISLIKNATQINLYTAAIGVSSVIFLLLMRKYFANLLMKLGLGKGLAGIIAKMGPVIAIVITILVTAGFGLDQQGVKIVGTVPAGLPSIMLPPFNMELWGKLLTPALLIAIVAYVASISVAQTLAAKKKAACRSKSGTGGIGSLKYWGFTIGWFSGCRRIFTFHC